MNIPGLMVLAFGLICTTIAATKIFGPAPVVITTELLSDYSISCKVGEYQQKSIKLTDCTASLKSATD
jgi:hypothetical protein